MTLWFQNWHQELGELLLEHSKVWKMYFNGLFLSKACNVSVRKFHRNNVSWHWGVMQYFKEKLARGLKKDIRKLVNFHASSRKLGNLYFDGLLLSNDYKVLEEKNQRRYASWHWRVMKVWWKTDSWFQKWGIWQILMRAVASL